jgi:hypothetical protein
MNEFTRSVFEFLRAQGPTAFADLRDRFADEARLRVALNELQCKGQIIHDRSRFQLTIDQREPSYLMGDRFNLDGGGAGRS